MSVAIDRIEPTTGTEITGISGHEFDPRVAEQCRTGKKTSLESTDRVCR